MACWTVPVQIPLAGACAHAARHRSTLGVTRISRRSSVDDSRHALMTNLQRTPPKGLGQTWALIKKGSHPMTLVSKFLPALALAIALFPLVAQAQTAPQQAQSNNQTVVYGGVNANSFPDSFGG
jgi:hypothetical protein